MHAIPTAVKEKKGTREKSREQPNELEFDSINEIPEPPDYFDEVAITEWKRATEILNNVGMLAEADIPQLRIYCYLISIVERAARKLEKESVVIEETNARDNKYKTKNKWISVYNEAADRVVKLGNQFGFSPSSRTKINMPKKNTKDGYYLD